MKKLLVQLDSDPHPSLFDRIVGYDAGADEVLSYGDVTADKVNGLIQGAFFTRGIPDLKNTAVWIGGSDVVKGEHLLAAAQASFFGPFQVSLMLDSNGCNTTAATAVAKLAAHTELRKMKAVVIGMGPVGTRAAMLLAHEGAQVMLASVPASLFGDKFNEALHTKSIDNARKMVAASNHGINLADVRAFATLERLLADADIAVTAGPAGISILPHTFWATHASLTYLVDFNLTDPTGLEGINIGDNFTARDGKKILGPLGIGNPKMQVHKACIGRLFAQNDLILDAAGVYTIAKEIVTR